MTRNILQRPKAFVRTSSACFLVKKCAAWCLCALSKCGNRAANHWRLALWVLRDRMVVVIQLLHPAKGRCPLDSSKRIRRFASHA